MKKAFLCLLTFAVLLLIVPSALALTVSLYAPANVGITGVSLDSYRQRHRSLRKVGCAWPRLRDV